MVWNKLAKPSVADIVAAHPPKTGGSSVFSALGVGHGHRTAAEQKRIVDECDARGSPHSHFPNRYIIGTMRNPWDQIESWFYYYMIPHQKWTQGFEKWILEGRPNAGVGAKKQIDFFFLSGADVVDFYLHHETLQADYTVLINYILDGDFPAKLPHLAQTNYPAEREPWTRDMLAAVHDECHDFCVRVGHHYRGPGERPDNDILLPKE